MSSEDGGVKELELGDEVVVGEGDEGDGRRAKRRGRKREGKGYIGVRGRRKILDRMLHAEGDVETLSGMLGVSLEDLSRWAGQDDTQEVLQGLRLLAEMQAQLILSRYRVTAAARLVGLASQRDDDELARKACCEILKLELLDRDRRMGLKVGGKADGVDAGVLEGVDEGKLLEAMERLGNQYVQ